jgi:hypothetical protein
MKTDGNPLSHHPKRMNHPVHPKKYEDVQV